MGSKIEETVVHPLVLLSVVDHYNRQAKDTSRRVIGALLGTRTGASVEVTASYAVPFEEDARNPEIWYVDHNYHERMLAMKKKVDSTVEFVGWYSTGPAVRRSDIEIHSMWARFTPQPVFVIVDVQPVEIGLPVRAFATVDEVSEDGASSRAVFARVPSRMGQEEAEEVAVEHLLRDVTDTTRSSLVGDIHNKVQSLRSLDLHLADVLAYLRKVCAGDMPLNQAVLAQLQNIFNLLPRALSGDMVRAFNAKNNDMMAMQFVAALVRAVVALHDLINNKISLRDAATREREGDAKKLGRGLDEDEEDEEEMDLDDFDFQAMMSDDDFF